MAEKNKFREADETSQLAVSLGANVSKLRDLFVQVQDGKISVDQFYLESDKLGIALNRDYSIVEEALDFVERLHDRHEIEETERNPSALKRYSDKLS